MSNIPNGQNIFVVDIEYCVPLEQAEPHMEAHMQFVAEMYDAGLFLASGPKVPRTGGVVLATAPSKETLMGHLTGDPFLQHSIANYNVTEFVPRRTVDGL